MPNPYLRAALQAQQEKRRHIAAQTEGYDALYVADLNAEIERRNRDRDEADLIVPSGSKKADLIQALEADDRTNPPSEES